MISRDGTMHALGSPLEFIPRLAAWCRVRRCTSQ
jgi:hypothetical protein